jgi:hypothetical protein
LVAQRLRELLEMVSGADEEPESPSLPVGNGLFISRLHKIPIEDIERLVVQAKLKWVAVLRLWQHKNEQDRTYNVNDEAQGKIDHLRSCGVTVWPWAYPQSSPDGWGKLRDSLCLAADNWRSPGVIIDPELPFIGCPSQAAGLMERLEDLRPIGVTSYGAPWFHQRFPFMAFSGADFSIPQTYDAKNNMGPGYPQRSYDEWRAKGHKHIIGGFGTFRKTTAQLEELLKNIWDTGVPGICGWKWETTSAQEFDTIGRMAP